MNRRHRPPTQRLAALHAAKEAGLHLYVALAPTYPECDEADLRVTLRAVAELKPVTIFHEPINIRADNVTRIRAHAETLGVHLRSDVFMTRETWQDYAVRALRTVERLAREIKQAVGKLPPRKKLALARWLRAQVDDRLSDEEMMAIAAEGARVLDKREAALPNAKRGEVWQIELWPGCQGASGFGPRLRHCGRRLGLGHCGLPHDGSPRFPL